MHHGIATNQPVTASIVEEYNGNRRDVGFVMSIDQSLSFVSARYLNAVIILLIMSHMTIAKAVADIYSCSEGGYSCIIEQHDVVRMSFRVHRTVVISRAAGMVGNT